ncbi:LuxR C-terminal-related transcriptional regulator [Dictyobacter arantiisoli]|uniref:Helix-turn-helix transcriptional regulator n=1 Tax=Dictyobacter arantiisoli TaxID=2014874 RepID=A0A5A5TLB1_9CHLR|nr:LuxR C-terminal-related transcriptional regulator [Dictyobacter arantiisoli]GCF11754.1 helix-turn-helix transcriptional regulator [Dictyobacter arantiisoli]
MPKSPTYRLIWSAERNAYELHTPDHSHQRFVPEDEASWLAWLATCTSFSFQGHAGRLNVYKELRSRGAGYWYAYHSTGRRVAKRYLGRTATLTLRRLEEAAQSLTNENPASLMISTLTEKDGVFQATTARLPEEGKEKGDLPSTLPSSQMEQLDLKLRLPRLPTSLIERTHLYALLDAGFARKLTLISAPAGFGKTTLVRAWITRRRDSWLLSRPASERTNQDHLLVAWVTLDDGDNEPLRFWGAILAACQTFSPHEETGARALLETAQYQTMLATFLQYLSRLPTHCILVLEDYHVIRSPLLHEMLASLLARVPDTLHVILITRVDPPLPLARLRANGELQEVRDADLRFALTEAQAFLQQMLPFPLDTAVSERMYLQTEGWVTGLRLLALALQGYRSQQESEPLLASFSGTLRYILVYLVEEVLAVQPDALQLFLLQTSGLNRLTASLCDAVTDRDDSDLLLEQVERANLFLQPLDESQQWYRYHALWARALQREAHRRLGATTLHTLNRKASSWYEQQGLLPDAIEAAFASEDFPRVAMLIERLLLPKSFHNPYHLLRRLLERVPKDVLDAHPELRFAYAESRIFTSDRRDPSNKKVTEQALRIAEQGFRVQRDDQKLAQVLSLRATLAFFQNDLLTAFALAHQMLLVQPEGELHWRGSSLVVLGIEALLAGKMEEAWQRMMEARVAYEADQSFPGLLATAFVLGEISMEQGELHQADLYYQQALAGSEPGKEELFQHQLTTVTGAQETFFKCQTLFGLAQLAYERNELDAAEQWLSQVRVLGAPLVEEMHFLTAGTLLQAYILHARGQSAQAQKLLSQIAVQARSPQFLREVRACVAQIALATGDLTKACEWSRTIEHAETPLALLRQEEEALLLARLRIAQARSEEALRILAPWKTQAETQQRLRSTLEILLLEALAHFAQARLPEAKQALLPMLTRTQGKGYQRLFLNEGRAMETLLKTLVPELREAPLLSSVRTLLHAFAQEYGTEDTSPSRKDSLLLEPLSPQEQRVLHLLVAGQTYGEIAQELVVSLNTIKTQISSVYRKLGANRRAEAIARAQRLHLL